MGNSSTTKPVLKLPWVRQAALSAAVLSVFCGLFAGAQSRNSPQFHFALLGDRTGEPQPGVYPEAWREAAADNPAFFLTVGDTIQGGNDKTIDAEWNQVRQSIAPFHRFQLFLTPGNHDVWDPASAAAYCRYSHHPLHYSFDWRQAHFVILDDSETDELKPEELAFLKSDLAAHRAQPVKFVISHRPSWLLRVVMGDPNFSLHRIARQYGVQYILAGHLHQMLHFNLDGITYLSIASSGGHLRNDKSYSHGWFFQHTDVLVNGNSATFRIEELRAPFGQGRVTSPNDWGAASLVSPPAS